MVFLNAVANAPVAQADPIPLVVDLDGTLLRTDSLIESLFVFARTMPERLFDICRWLTRGRAYFKAHLSCCAIPDAHTLPYQEDVVAFLREQKLRGRHLVLATGADERIAGAIALETGLFDRIMASDGKTNLTGVAKCDRLLAEFGQRGFDYIGNDRCDLPVWYAARNALLVSPSKRLAREVADVTPIERRFGVGPASWTDSLQALRIHHWTKNVLVFLPLVAARESWTLSLFGRAMLAFLAFSLCASSVYLLNDLFDLPADRRHPDKKNRKLASGQMTPLQALSLLPLLLGSALLLASTLSAGCAYIVGLYFLVMLAYSAKLKDIPLLDVSVLAGGYALRVLLGALATHLTLSAGLPVVCVLLFYSIALIKRYTELLVSESLNGVASAHARGYLDVDKVVLVAQGIAGGYLAVFALALYLNTESSRRSFSHSYFLWACCCLLFYWINYMWLMTTRGRMHHDPVVFALTDPVGRGLMLAIGALAAAAI